MYSDIRGGRNAAGKARATTRDLLHRSSGLTIPSEEFESTQEAAR